MADNVAITAGSGTTVATDQIPGTLEHIQVVKLADGTADSATRIPGDATNGLDVDVTRVQGTVTVDSELTTADLDTGAGTDTRAVVGLVGAKSGGAALIPGDATKGLAVDLTATGQNATALKVDGSAVTQPVSGSVTADTELTTADLDTGGGTDTRAVVGIALAKSGGAELLAGNGSNAMKVDGSGVTQPVSISGTVPVSFGNGTTRIQVQSSGLTTGATAYSAGDVLGQELSFASAAASASTFTIVSATLIDSAKVTGSVDLFLFDQSGVTHASDNAANSWSDADMLKCVGVISFPPPIFSANNSIATVPYVGLAGKLAAGTTLYGLLVTRIGHTFFGAATDLAVTLTIQKD